MHRRLSAYALAVSGAAAGLASISPADAEIIYKPTHRTLTNGNLLIRLGGTDDFNLTDQFYTLSGSWSSQRLDINPEGGAAVAGSNQSAFALKAGAVVGSADKFQTGKILIAGAFNEVQISSTRIFGPFANTSNRYLGLKFTLNGQVHYGWARFSKVVAVAKNVPKVSATLTGFAYETIPNKAIVAGKTKGRSELQPASLGHLARGSSAISEWRE